MWDWWACLWLGQTGVVFERGRWMCLLFSSFLSPFFLSLLVAVCVSLSPCLSFYFPASRNTSVFCLCLFACLPQRWKISAVLHHLQSVRRRKSKHAVLVFISVILFTHRTITHHLWRTTQSVSGSPGNPHRPPSVHSHFHAGPLYPLTSNAVEQPRHDWCPMFVGLVCIVTMRLK